MKRSLPIVLFLIAGVLAGCLDDDTATSEDEEVEPGSTEEGGPLGLDPDLTLAQANVTEQETVRIEESHTIGLEGALGGQPHEGRNFHSISDLLSPGVGMDLRINVSWDPPPVGNGNVVWTTLQWTGDAVHGFENVSYDYPNGTATLSAFLQPAGSPEVTLVVGRNMQIDTDVEEDYELEIVLDPITDRIPAMGLAAVDVPADGALVVEPVENTSGRLLVYDDADRLHSDLDVEEPMVVVDNLSQATEFILVSSSEDLEVRVFVAQQGEDPAPVLRHLGVPIDHENPVQVNQGSASFSVQADRPLVRFFVIAGPSESLDPKLYQDAELQVVAPDGTVVLTGTLDFIIQTITPQIWRTSFGDPALSVGEYTVEYESSLSVNVELQVAMTHYER